MDDSVLFFAIIMIYFALVISSILKLNFYKVRKIKFYFITFLFPIIIVTLNMYVIIKSYDEMDGRIKVTQVFDMLINFFRITIIRLPLSLGCLCHSIKQYEVDRKENYDISKSYYNCLVSTIINE